MNSDCFMCDIASGGDTGHWYDAVLQSTGHALVVPALGAITAGHVLVVPHPHVRSVQLLDVAARDGVVATLTGVVNHLAHTFGVGVTVFEHGASVAGSGPRSACSEHAHIQVLPGAFAASDELDQPRRYPSLASFYSSDAPFDPYLMIRDPDAEVLVSPDVGVSQYFRRMMLAERGEPDTWDYWVFPRAENVEATIRAFAR